MASSDMSDTSWDSSVWSQSHRILGGKYLNVKPNDTFNFDYATCERNVLNKTYWSQLDESSL